MARSVDKRKLILEGPMNRAIFSLSLPLMLNNLIMTLYHMADSIFVGQLGTTEFAAVSFIGPVMFLFIALGFGIQIAGTSILSQFIGKGEKASADAYAKHILATALFLGLILAGLGILGTPLLVGFMGGTGQLGRLSQDYLRIVFLGTPFQIFFMACQAIMNAQGNTKATTIVNGLSSLVNVILDPFFIFTSLPFLNLPGLGLGVSGAALATVISQMVLAVFGYYFMLRTSHQINPRRPQAKWDINKFKKIFGVAIPSAAGQSGAAFGFVILNSFIAAYGTDTVAAFSLINRITDMVMMPAMGIGAGLTAIVGQNMGAQNIQRVRLAFKRAALFAAGIAGLGILAILAVRLQLIYLFTPKASDSVVAQSLDYLYFVALTIPLMGLFSVFQGLFQGSGHTRYSMYMAIGRLWLIRIPMILLLNRFADLGPRAIWLSMTASNIIISLYGWAIYRSGRWKREIL